MSKNQVAIVEADAVVVNMMRASSALAQAQTIQQTKKIVDAAHAAEIYAKRQKLGEEAMGMAASIKVEALRKLGEMLKATPRAKGEILRGSILVPREDDAETLAELGLTKKESAVAQKLAALPDEDFKQVRDGHVSISKAIAAVESIKPKAPPPPPVDQPQDDGPDADEIAASEAAQRADAEAMQKLLDSDDKLSTAYAQIKQLNAELAVVKLARDGWMNKANEAIKSVKRLQAKVDKLERATA